MSILFITKLIASNSRTLNNAILSKIHASATSKDTASFLIKKNKNQLKKNVVMSDREIPVEIIF